MFDDDRCVRDAYVVYPTDEKRLVSLSLSEQIDASIFCNAGLQRTPHAGFAAAPEFGIGDVMPVKSACLTIGSTCWAAMAITPTC